MDVITNPFIIVTYIQVKKIIKQEKKKLKNKPVNGRLIHNKIYNMHLLNRFSLRTGTKIYTWKKL